ncbi:MAG TPA: hypothetical protein VF609_15415 [Flavisolibacter sp.]
MRKCLFSFFLTALPIVLLAQNLDSMGKYSYLVLTEKGCGKQQATGFFARYQHRLFFVTAAQSLAGWQAGAQKPGDNVPDTIFIRLSNDTGRISYLPLPVANLVKANPPGNSEGPGVYVTEIMNGKNYNVLSIEDFFEDEVPCELAKSVLIAGYSQPENSTDYYRARQQPFTLGTPLENPYCTYTYRPEVKHFDYLHYFAAGKEKLAAAGLSGAPAYLVAEDASIVFGGMYVGGLREGSGTGMILRPEHVLNKIKDKIFGR